MRFLLYFIFGAIFSKSVNAQYLPGASYYGINNYIEYIAGDMPIIIVAPHAGELEPSILPNINTRDEDNGTMELALYMADSLRFKSGGCRPHIIINHLNPNKLNPVYSEADSVTAAGTNPLALHALRDFHLFIQIAHDKVTADWGKGHYFELHGNGTSEEWNMIGLGVSKNYLGLPDSVIMTRVNYSTVKHLCTVGGANFLEVLKGETSLGGMLAVRGWKSAPSPSHPSPPDSVTFFYAGHNTWRYGSKNSGTIDATHLESYWKFMVLPANQSKYFNDLSDAMLSFMSLHYGFSFSCQTLDQSEAITGFEPKIYPNPIPTHSILTIESRYKPEEILIFNSLGQLCWHKNDTERQIVLDLDQGYYTLIIKSSNGKTEHKKLVVR
jgi:Secretion system C-terminal sorting domain